MSRLILFISLFFVSLPLFSQELAMDTEERRYDADTALHGHFHCSGCGGIADFPLDEGLVQQLIPDGFAVQNQGIYFSGLCPACRAADPTQEN